MSTKLTTKSTIKLANAGHSEKQAFDVGAVLGLTGSQTTNGVKYSFEAEENTVTGKGVAVQGLLGPYVALEKSTGLRGYGLLTATLGYNTARKGFLAKLKHKFNRNALELGAQYSDVSKQTSLDASVKPNASNKLAASYNVTKDVAKAKHTLTADGFQLITGYSLQPAEPPAFEATKLLPRSLGSASATHSLATGATGIEHTSLPLPRVGGVLTTAYSLKDGGLSLQWVKKLVSVGVATRYNGQGLTHPTLSVSVSKNYSESDFRSLVGWQDTSSSAGTDSSSNFSTEMKPSAMAGSGAVAAASDPITEDKLRRIDVAYQQELSRLAKQNAASQKRH